MFMGKAGTELVIMIPFLRWSGGGSTGRENAQRGNPAVTTKQDRGVMGTYKQLPVDACKTVPKTMSRKGTLRHDGR